MKLSAVLPIIAIAIIMANSAQGAPTTATEIRSKQQNATDKSIQDRPAKSQDHLHVEDNGHDHGHNHNLDPASNEPQDENPEQDKQVQGEEGSRKKRYNHSHCYSDHCHDYYSDGHSHVRYYNNNYYRPYNYNYYRPNYNYRRWNWNNWW